MKELQSSETFITWILRGLKLRTMNKDELLDLLKGGKIQLNPSQKGISFPIVRRIYKKMKIGLKFDTIQFAEKSNIVNGHHRYLASLFAEVKFEMVECPLTSAKKSNKVGISRIG